jgi:hypothetical protein
MSGVEESYLGVLPATEFLKRVESDTGEIRASLFLGSSGITWGIFIGLFEGM